MSAPTPRPYTDAELEAGAEALYESAKGKLRTWEQYVQLGPPGADFYFGKVAVVLDVVLPDHDARVRADERARVAEEIAQDLLSGSDAHQPGPCRCGAVDMRSLIELLASIARDHATPPTTEEDRRA